jgi:hypothetical protein
MSVMLTAKGAITELSSRYEDEDESNLADAAQRKVVDKRERLYFKAKNGETDPEDFGFF